MRVLVVEDDPELNSQIVARLQEQQYNTDSTLDGEEALFMGATQSYDVILLDLGLGQLSGLEILKKWRQNGVDSLVIVITVRDRWSEKVEVIDAGADDYITKPFYLEELTARLRALIRRACGHSSNEITCGTVVVNIKTGAVTVEGKPVRLTSQEYRLLSHLIQQQGKLVSRLQIMEHLYGQNFDSDSNIIDVLIGRLRKKLVTPIIRTVRGLGYIVEASGNDA